MADISTPSGQYTEYEAKRELPRALMGGTAKMREEGHKFLPQFPAESDESYKVRLNSTTLYNGFSDTIKKMVGKVFSKNIQLNPDIPPQIVELMPNIDGQGRNHTAFFLDAFRDAMIDGVSFVFVDFPVVTPATDGQSPTMADQQAQGARPNTVLICAENLIDWDHKSIGGAEILTEVRIKERFTEQDPGNAWAEIEIEQIRLLRPGSFEIWRKEKDNTINSKWVLYDEGTTSLSYIPLIPIYTNRTGYYCGDPPLMPLAELNQEHWISTSEQRKALTFARFAMLVLSGVNPDSNVDVGPDKVLKVPQGASAAYAEPSGTGIEAGRLDLEAIEARMQHAGMSIQVQTQGGNVTATATAIGSYEANSALMAAATSLEDSINQVLQVFADYMGLADGGSVTINKTFGQMPATGTIPELVTLHTAGLVSTETIMSELKRRGMLDESIDTEAEIERISSQMYGMSAPVEQPVQSTLEAIEQPVIDMQPMLDAMAAIAQNQAMLSEAMTGMMQPQEITPPIDNAPMLIEALRELGAQNSDALAAILAEVSKPVEPTQVTVNAPITMPPTTINLPAAAPITVNAGDVNVPAAQVTVNVPEQPPANVTVNNLPQEGKKAITVERDSKGKIIGAITAEQLMRINASILNGKVTGAGTGTEVFRDLGDTKDRVIVTTDTAGNRTAIVRDGT